MTTVVVGGGVVGLCAAHHLQKLGEDVVVVEAGVPGAAASWGNAGWVVPCLSGPVPDAGTLRFVARTLGSPDSPVYFRPQLDAGLLPWMWRFARSCTRRRHMAGLHATARLGARTMALFDELRDDGVTFDMWSQGLLFVGLTPRAVTDELAYLRALEAYGYRLPAVLSSGTELLSREPSLSPRVAGGFVVEEERHVDPRSLTAGLVAALRSTGGTVLDKTRVLGFARRNGQVAAVETDRGPVESDNVVLAAGAWSGQLARQLGVFLPMRSGKGYSFSVEPHAIPSRPLYLLEAKVGVTPFGSRVRVAGTMELAGLDTAVDERRLRAMQLSAGRYLHDLDAGSVAEAWAGLRPLTPDGLPVIGRAPGIDNAFLATGHAMLGVTLGPATGEALARLIVRGETDAVLAPFAADRFVRRGRRAPAPVAATVPR